MHDIYESRPDDHPFDELRLRRVWSVDITAGNVSGKRKWILIWIALVGLSFVLAVLLGIVGTLTVPNGDVGVFTWLGVFLTGVVASCLFVYRRFGKRIQLIALEDRLELIRADRCICQWTYPEIDTIEHDDKPSGIGLSAILPSDLACVWITGGGKTARAELISGSAVEMIDLIKARCAHAIVTSPLGPPSVPIQSDQPERIYRKKLNMEFKSALKLIGLGLLGTMILILFIWGFANEHPPRGPIGLILLGGFMALTGPFGLVVGSRQLLSWINRRRRFAECARNGSSDRLKQLLAEIYGDDGYTQQNQGSDDS